MKKEFLLCLVFLLAGHAVFAGGRVENGVVSSAILGVEKPYSVYLPDGYDDTSDGYPVLYLLHGAFGCHTDWVKMGFMKEITDNAIEGGMCLPLIVVMPDARGEGDNMAGKNMGYFNVPGWHYEDFFFDELVKHVENEYRIIADKKHRAVAGLSMGGGASVVYAQRHSDMFGSACAMSGTLGGLFTRTASRDNTAEYIESVNRTAPVSFVESADESTLDNLRTVRWWVDCGDDDHLCQDNMNFYMAMRSKNVPLQFRVRDGAHTWIYWRSALTPVLQFVSTGFAD